MFVSDIFGNDWLQLVEQRVDMERKFLEHSLLRSESSTGAKVPWNESSWTFHSPGANVPRNESSTGAKVLSMVFLLPGTKVQRNEKASYLIKDCTQGITLLKLTTDGHKPSCSLSATEELLVCHLASAGTSSGVVCYVGCAGCCNFTSCLTIQPQ